MLDPLILQIISYRVACKDVICPGYFPRLPLFEDNMDAKFEGRTPRTIGTNLIMKGSCEK